MNYREDIPSDVDWSLVGYYLLFVFFGWLNIYAAVYDASLDQNIFDMSINSGKQLLWIATCAFLILIIMVLDHKFYEQYAYLIYLLTIALLISVLFLGREVAGSRSWFEIGSFRLQPAEFAKFATVLVLARYINEPGVKMELLNHQIKAAILCLLPVALIILQGDTGSALVFFILILVFYREGMPPFLLIVGILSALLFIFTLLVDKYLLTSVLISIALVISLRMLFKKLRKKWRKIALVWLGLVMVAGVIFSVDYFIHQILKPHQQNRIKALINPEADPLGYGWNVTQSKIAIGSGGLLGKGFLEGTQTKYDFVPEQSTDFIFCTIGEEHGFWGSFLLVAFWMGFLFRLIVVAERQKSKFSRAFGYGVSSIFFFHFMINVGMTIGLFPVIGIPLPFFSYGGSSLWSFTILLFIFIKLDAHRSQVLERI
jgi:rod shape determining protein RodA